MRKESLKKDGNKNGTTDADAEFDALFNLEPRNTGDQRDGSSASPPAGSSGIAKSAATDNGADAGDNDDEDDSANADDVAAASTSVNAVHAVTLSSSFSSKTKAARKATHISYADDAKNATEDSDDDDAVADATKKNGDTVDDNPNLSMDTDADACVGAATAADASTTYEVEDIMGHKLVRKRLLFLVRWKGYEASDDTWESEAALNCAEIIERYRSEHPDAVQPVSIPKAIKLPKAEKATKRRASNAVDNTEYEVEQIVGHRIERKKNLFLIRWKGFEPEQDTWEPEATLACPDLLKEYMEAHSSDMAPVKVKKTPKKRVSASEKDYEVRAVLAKRVLGGVVQYQVRWKNYGSASDSWEKETNLNCAELIAKFEKNENAKRPSSHRGAKVKAVAAYDSESDAEVLPKKKQRRSEPDEEESFEVERIVDVKTERGKKIYLVKWKGWPAASNTWEPLASLSCAALLKQFEDKQRPVAKSPKRAAVPTKAARKSTAPAPVTPRSGVRTPKKSPATAKRSASVPAVKRSAAKTTKAASAAKVPAVKSRGRPSKSMTDEVDPLACDENEDKEWEVEKIVDVETLRDGSRQFLIRWKGCDASADTWEPEENVDSPKLVEAFLRKSAGTPKKTTTPKKKASPKKSASKKSPMKTAKKVTKKSKK